MHTFKTSKPELWLREHVQAKYLEMGFKGNQRLMSLKHFQMTKSHKRQIDLLSRSHKVIVEVDGYLHFHNVSKWGQLARVQAKDAELNRAAPLMGYMLVRVSYDQWNQATGELCDDAIDLLDMHMSFVTPGTCFIGSMYPRHEPTEDGCERFETALGAVAARMGMTSMELLQEART